MCSLKIISKKCLVNRQRSKTVVDLRKVDERQTGWDSLTTMCGSWWREVPSGTLRSSTSVFMRQSRVQQYRLGRGKGPRRRHLEQPSNARPPQQYFCVHSGGTGQNAISDRGCRWLSRANMPSSKSYGLVHETLLSPK